jgi:hypothetical protein
MLLFNKMFLMKEAKNKIDPKKTNIVRVPNTFTASPTILRKRINSFDTLSLPSSKKLCL